MPLKHHLDRGSLHHQNGRQLLVWSLVCKLFHLETCGAIRRPLNLLFLNCKRLEAFKLRHSFPVVSTDRSNFRGFNALDFHIARRMFEFECLQIKGGECAQATTCLACFAQNRLYRLYRLQRACDMFGE